MNGRKTTEITGTQVVFGSQRNGKFSWDGIWPALNNKAWGISGRESGQYLRSSPHVRLDVSRNALVDHEVVQCWCCCLQDGCFSQSNRVQTNTAAPDISAAAYRAPFVSCEDLARIRARL